MGWSSFTRADKVTRAVFGVDRRGRVQLWNAAMEQLTGWPAAELLGKPWEATVGDRAGKAWLVARGRLGLRTSALTIRTRSPALHKLRLSVTAWPVASTEHALAGVLCWPEAGRSAVHVDGAPESSIEIDLSQPRFGLITRVFGQAPATLVGQRCFEVLVRQGAPCTNCPALALGGHRGDATRAVVTDPHANLVVVSASRTSPRSAQLCHEAVDRDLFAGLVRARLDALANDHKLSVREREVLHSIARGASAEDTARELAITRRTVKFHAGNLLHKLNIASRNEILRLLLDPASVVSPPAPASGPKARRTTAPRRPART